MGRTAISCDDNEKERIKTQNKDFSAGTQQLANYWHNRNNYQPDYWVLSSGYFLFIELILNPKGLLSHKIEWHLKTDRICRKSCFPISNKIFMNNSWTY